MYDIVCTNFQHYQFPVARSVCPTQASEEKSAKLEAKLQKDTDAVVAVMQVQ